MNTYRVWMKDGYASLHCAETEDEARSAAVKNATTSIDGAAMSPREKRQAVTVDYAEKLNRERP